jgi:hypothetical protein
MIELNLRWFEDEEPEVETPDVPNIPGVGGVLTVWKEVDENEDVWLRATFKEIQDAVNSGWIVGVFDGMGACDLVVAAALDETGDDPIYGVETLTGATFTAASEDEQLKLNSEIDDGDGDDDGETSE